MKTFLLLITLAFAITVVGQTPTPAPVEDDEPIRVETTLINIPFVVSDRDGRHVAGVKKEDVFVKLDGEDQPIEYFADSEAPVSVAIILDMSGSTRPHIGQIRDAAKKFVDKLNPADQAMVLTFDQRAKIDLVVGLTSDRKKLKDKIGGVSHYYPGFGPSDPRKLPIFPDMYDTIYRVLNSEFAGVTGRKAVIVLTDGFIVGRTVDVPTFDDALIEGDVVIYPMMFLTAYHVGRGKTSISAEELFQLPVTMKLDDIAKKTGGRLMIAGKGTDFKAAFEAVADELRKQYMVGFYPTKPDIARGGKVALGVTTPGLRVRTKNVIRLKKGGSSK